MKHTVRRIPLPQNIVQESLVLLSLHLHHKSPSVVRVHRHLFVQIVVAFQSQATLYIIIVKYFCLQIYTEVDRYNISGNFHTFKIS